jgi:hypothetical protein
LFLYASDGGIGAIAPIGHTDAHVPHEMHFDLSIAYFPSEPGAIAPTGHIPAQLPQPIHLLGSILYVIFSTFLFFCCVFIVLISVKQA